MRIRRRAKPGALLLSRAAAHQQLAGRGWLCPPALLAQRPRRVRQHSRRHNMKAAASTSAPVSDVEDLCMKALLQLGYTADEAATLTEVHSKAVSCSHDYGCTRCGIAQTRHLLARIDNACSVAWPDDCCAQLRCRSWLSQPVSPWCSHPAAHASCKHAFNCTWINAQIRSWICLLQTCLQLHMD